MRRSNLSLRSNNHLLSVTASAVLFVSVLYGQTNNVPADLGALIRVLDQTGLKYDRTEMEAGLIEIRPDYESDWFEAVNDPFNVWRVHALSFRSA